jgi:hypothetical protein
LTRPPHQLATATGHDHAISLERGVGGGAARQQRRVLVRVAAQEFGG